MIGWFHSSDATCLEFSITGITTCWEQCRWPSWRSKKLPTPGSFWKFPAGPGYRSTSGRWSPLGHWNSGDFWIMYFMWSDLEGTFFGGGIPVFWGGFAKYAFLWCFFLQIWLISQMMWFFWAGAELNHLLGRCLCAPGLSWGAGEGKVFSDLRPWKSRRFLKISDLTGA
jgi:hypothetical protein